MKPEITSAPIFSYYHQAKPLLLQTAISFKGLCAVLPEDGQPIYFAEKAYNDTKDICNYWVHLQLIGQVRGSIASYMAKYFC